MIDNKVIWMDGLKVERTQDSIWEVFQVGCHDAVSMSGKCSNDMGRLSPIAPIVGRATLYLELISSQFFQLSSVLNSFFL